MIYDTKQKSIFKYLFCWPKQNRCPSYPTWLVQAANMTRVAGSEAGSIGYCALSYPQRSSGSASESFRQEHHEVITYPNGKRTVQQVTFEAVLQQICADFDIEYLWYDTMCIDQSLAQKLCEINKVNRYYSVARFTIALIPEMELPPNHARAPPAEILRHCLQLLHRSEWAKNLWTFHDTSQSKNILFVGRNVYFSSDQLRMINNECTRLEYPIIDTTEELVSFPQCAATLLLHAHSRHCDEPYDRVFALASILRDFGYHSVTHFYTYDLPLETLMIKFYQTLVMEDLTVMCFGKPQAVYRNTFCQYHYLPSWTGVSGVHCSRVLKKTSESLGRSCSIENGNMRISCDYISVVPKQYTMDKSTNVPCSIEKMFGVKVTHYATGTRKSEAQDSSSIKYVTYMSLIDDDCAKCIILDLPFDSDRGFCCPLIAKQQNGRYRIIGVSFYTLMEWTFDELTEGTLKHFGSQSNATFVI
ncbi:hypothetical protein BJV82DRAFT_624339, partial [Fennellomyces sp. T-0311]